MTIYNMRERLHGTAEEAAQFIVWFVTNEHVSEWDKTRYANAIEMVKLDESLLSRIPDDAKWLDWQIKIAFAEMCIAYKQLTNCESVNGAELSVAASKVGSLEEIVSSGIRSQSLLDEMRRVTEELSK